MIKVIYLDRIPSQDLSFGFGKPNHEAMKGTIAFCDESQLFTSPNTAALVRLVKSEGIRLARVPKLFKSITSNKSFL